MNGDWRPRLFDNRYVVSAVVGWKLDRHWEASARFLLAGGKAFTSIDKARSAAAGRTVIDEARFQEDHLPAYQSLNLRLDRRFHLPRQSVVAYVSVWNVFDRENVRRYYWSASRNEVVPEFQWGMVPVLGLEFEF